MRWKRLGFALYLVAAIALVTPSLARRLTATAATSSPDASVSPSTIAAVASTVPSPSLKVTLMPTPTPTPSASARALVATSYKSGARTFAALTIASPPYTVDAPMAGRVSVVVYQLLGGEIRIGSDVPSEPFFPYVTVTSADRRLTLRPGALGTDVQLVAKDGQTVSIGEPLFRVVGPGPSSWRAFYDRTVTAQVIASLAILPSGIEIDPLPLLGP